MGLVATSLVAGAVSAGLTVAEYNLAPKTMCADRGFKSALLRSAQIAVTVSYLAQWIPNPFLIPTFGLSLLVMPSITKAIHAPKPWKVLSTCASIFSRVVGAIIPTLVISSSNPILAGISFFIFVPAHILPCFDEVKYRWAKASAT